MSTATSTTVAGIGTLAQYKDVLNAIDGAFTTMGWTKGTDAGTLNISTIAATPVAGANTGWIIYKMGDSLQATAPCFLKITFGAGAGNAAILHLNIQLGTGSNGSGTLTGQVATALNLELSNQDTSYATHVSHYCGASNRMVFSLFDSGPNNYFNTQVIIFSIERLHDATGVDTAGGFQMIAASNGVRVSYVVTATGTIPSYYLATNCSAPPTGSGVNGVNTYLFPVRCWAPQEVAPSLNLAAYFNADLTQFNPVVATMWDGVGHTVLPLGVSGNAAVSASYGGTTVYSMRWE